MIFWAFICIANYARFSSSAYHSSCKQSAASSSCTSFIYCQLQMSAVAVLSLPLLSFSSPAIQFNYFSFSCFVFLNRCLVTTTTNTATTTAVRVELTCMQQLPPTPTLIGLSRSLADGHCIKHTQRNIYICVCFYVATVSRFALRISHSLSLRSCSPKLFLGWMGTVLCCIKVYSYRNKYTKSSWICGLLILLLYLNNIYVYNMQKKVLVP